MDRNHPVMYRDAEDTYVTVLADALRESGDPVLLGIGISTYTEMCGLAPSRWLGEQGLAA